MSEYAEFTYDVRAETRRRERENRIRDTTHSFLSRYEGIVADLERQGLHEYGGAGFADAKRALTRVRSLLASDPEAARDLNMQIGSQIGALPAYARAARREAEQQERLRQEQRAQMQQEATTEVGRIITASLQSFTDPVERDFAFDELRALQSEFEAQRIAPEKLAAIRSQIERRVETIRTASRKRADEWKNATKAAVEVDARRSLLDAHREQVRSDMAAAPKAATAALAELDKLAASIESVSSADFQSRLAKAMAAADDAVVDENCRRDTVRAVMESLTGAGFVVEKPIRSQGDSDEVVIRARKPAGSDAVFKVTNEGGFSYKFDNYEGMGCKADIDRILPQLQEIYGISLKDQRVLWTNPDRHKGTAKPIEDELRGQQRG
jgi:chromosome segregation ATPase